MSDLKFRLAKAGLASIVEIGALPINDLIYYDELCIQRDPKESQARQEAMQAEQMIEMFKNVK